jgi:CRISPR-associated protein Cmr1
VPIRVSGIRGQLRFWWRLLVSHRQVNPLSSTDLYEAERALWGGMSEGEEDHSSKVRLRIINIDWQSLKIESCAEYVPDNNDPTRYKSTPEFHEDIPKVLAYALFPGQGKLSRNRRQIEVKPTKLIFPRLNFTLRMECRQCTEQQRDEALEALRWWASFGGIGARTRRGLGSVQVDSLAPVTAEEARHFGCELRQKNAVTAATTAWKQAIEALQQFRQGVNVGRNPGAAPNRPGRSRWPEPDSIREITGQHRVKADGTAFSPAHPAKINFPRAAFGLPIVFHFQGERTDRSPDPQDCVLEPDFPGESGKDRLASPLVLKARAIEDGRFVPIALQLPIEHLNDLTLVLKNSGDAENRGLPHTMNRHAWWPTGDAARAKAQQISPMNNRGMDALSAFLEFFAPGDNS